MQHKIKWCYLCRGTENLTRDHVPPENLFPKPKPSNLITVPCCKSCNAGFSKLDEQFRVFVSAPFNVSDTGKAVMRNKVFGGSLKKSPALKKQMAKLATFYPDVDYFSLKFAVAQLNQFGAQHPTFIAMTSILTAEQRGDGIFQFWHGVAQEQRTAGMWIYQFYDAALFMVRHGIE